MDGVKTPLTEDPMSVTQRDRRMRHTCHWPGCDTEVPPSMWGCKAHWFTLPKRLRDRIWATYRRGQEVRKDPSAEYIRAAKDVQEWIAQFQQNMRHQGSKST